MFLGVFALILGACSGGDDDGAVDGATAADDGTAGDDGAAGDDGSSGGDTDRGTAADVFEKFNAMTGQERLDELVPLAQEEGAITFYTASSGMQPVVEAFGDKYEIDVELFRAGSQATLQRVIQEYSAGYYAVDVYEDAESIIAAREGFGHLYVNDELTDVVPGYDPNELVVPTRLGVFITGWNTNLTNDDEIPDWFHEFADPVWDGRIAIESGDWEWYAGLHDYYVDVEGWSTEEFDEMFATVMSYADFHNGHTTTAQLMLAGEFAASPSLFPQSVERELEADSNAPVAWRKADGSYVRPIIFQAEGALLMKNAPHPHAALLFMDFLITEGQEILALNDRSPTAIAQPGGPLDGIPNEELHLITNQRYIDERQEWTDRFDVMMRQ